jgi:hypothetical protein
MAAGTLPNPPDLKTAAANKWFCDPAMGAWTNRMGWTSKKDVCMAQLFPLQRLTVQACTANSGKRAG